jgi:hypothetical protein
VRTLASDDVNRITANAPKGTHGRVHASGDELFSALLQLSGLIRFAGHYSSDQYNSGGDSVGSALDHQKL